MLRTQAILSFGANLNYDKEQTEGGASLNPKISGDGSVSSRVKSTELVTGSVLPKLRCLKVAMVIRDGRQLKFLTKIPMLVEPMVRCNVKP